MLAPVYKFIKSPHRELSSFARNLLGIQECYEFARANDAKI